MSAVPLKVLLVAEDRKILRRLSRFLNTFGYETQQVADPHHVAFLLKTYAPDFLILDGGMDLTAAFSLCRAAGGSEDSLSPYTLLLLESPQVRELSAALQVGVDDFLTKPVDYGEVLARMRRRGQTPGIRAPLPRSKRDRRPYRSAKPQRFRRRRAGRRGGLRGGRRLRADGSRFPCADQRR